MIKKIQITIGVIYIAFLIVCIDLVICNFLFFMIEPSMNKQPIETPLPRSFSTIDLLWTESKYADKWPVSIRLKAFQSQKDTLHYSNEKAGVLFSILGEGRKEAKGSQDIYNFVTSRNADSTYKNQFSTFPGETPEKWLYKSGIADQASFACYKYPDLENPDCYWRARYKEFIVVFEIDWVPGVVDLVDIEKMISEVDQIMAEHLQLPLLE